MLFFQLLQLKGDKQRWESFESRSQVKHLQWALYMNMHCFIHGNIYKRVSMGFVILYVKNRDPKSLRCHMTPVFVVSVAEESYRASLTNICILLLEIFLMVRPDTSKGTRGGGESSSW